MLSTMTFLLFVTTLLQGWRNTQQWKAYQRGEVTRGQLVNQTTSTVIVAVATLALFVLGRVIG